MYRIEGTIAFQAGLVPFIHSIQGSDLDAVPTVKGLVGLLCAEMGHTLTAMKVPDPGKYRIVFDVTDVNRTAPEADPGFLKNLVKRSKRPGQPKLKKGRWCNGKGTD